TFPGRGVNASGSTNGAVVGCIFNDTAVNFGDNGCAVALSDASNLLVANSAFNRCQGCALGSYNCNVVRIEGNDFVDCRQVLSVLCWAPKGNRIEFVNNYISGSGRGGIERSEEHTSELQSLAYLVCRLLL